MEGTRDETHGRVQLHIDLTCVSRAHDSYEQCHSSACRTLNLVAFFTFRLHRDSSFETKLRTEILMDHSVIDVLLAVTYQSGMAHTLCCDLVQLLAYR